MYFVCIVFCTKKNKMRDCLSLRIKKGKERSTADCSFLIYVQKEDNEKYSSSRLVFIDYIQLNVTLYCSHQSLL